VFAALVQRVRRDGDVVSPDLAQPLNGHVDAGGTGGGRVPPDGPVPAGMRDEP